MQAVIIAVVTTLIGVIAAILAARYYFLRSVKHRLAVYSIPSPGIFYGVDPEVRKEISVQFQGEAVKHLSVVEFLVANEGADPIRESIEPLTFHFDDDVRIVDASVTYVQPDGRKIAVNTESEREFRCEFALLNPNEYFYVKVIADGAISRLNVKCTIVAENLPPKIAVGSASSVNIGPHSKRSDPILLVPAGVILLLAAIFALPLVGLYEVHPHYFPFAWSKFRFVWWLTVPLFMDGVFYALLVLISLFIGVGALIGDIPPRPHFKGPRRIFPPHYAITHSSFLDSESALERHPREQDES